MSEYMNIEEDSLIKSDIIITSYEKTCQICSYVMVNPYTYSDCCHTQCDQCANKSHNGVYTCSSCSHVESISLRTYHTLIKSDSQNEKYITCSQCQTVAYLSASCTLTNKCHFCRKINTDIYFNRPLQDILLRQQIKCQNSLLCLEPLTLENLPNHNKICDYRQTTCKNCDCMLMFNELDYHNDNLCFVPCFFCDENILYKNIEIHQNTLCDYTCDHCDETILRKDSILHNLTCLHRPVQCAWCNIVFKHYAMDSHVNECQQQPMFCELCETHVIKLNFEEHSTKSCPKLKLHCVRNCGLKIANMDLNKHEDVCIKKIIHCRNSSITSTCDESFYRLHQKDHNLFECKHSLINCPQNCNAILYRSDLDIHTQKLCPNLEIKCGCGHIVLNRNIGLHDKYHCTNRSVTCNSCFMRCSMSNFKSHSDACGEVPVVCAGCQRRMTRKLYNRHILVCNSRQQVTCHHCSIKIDSVNLSRHLNEYCSFNITNCRFCNEKLLKRNVVSHLKTSCKNRKVKCDFCPEYIVKKHMTNHIVQHVQN